MLLALASGCAGEEFDPFNRLTSLRVLAIKSEPVAPAPGEVTTLSSLLYVPEGMPDPNSAGYTRAVVDNAMPVIEAAGGHTFFL